jgi:tetratricopeptide (TPR) repeat protein
MADHDHTASSRLEQSKSILAEHPCSDQLSLEYSRLLHNTKAGTVEETVEALERAARLSPDLDLRLRIGDALIDAGRIKEGLREMYGFLGDNPRAFGYCILARDLINVGKYRRARKALRRAIAINPRNAEVFWFIRRTRALRPKKVEKSGHAYSN